MKTKRWKFSAETSTNIYPKSQAPVNWTVLSMANARADRWMKRYMVATARIKELEQKIKELEEV